MPAAASLESSQSISQELVTSMNKGKGRVRSVRVVQELEPAQYSALPGHEFCAGSFLPDYMINP
jgi:hypothetical protein